MQTQMSGFTVVHLILRERGSQKGIGDRRGERRKPPFEQVHLSYRGGRGREEQAVPTRIPVTSVLTCWRTRPGVMRAASLSLLPAYDYPASRKLNAMCGFSMYTI